MKVISSSAVTLLAASVLFGGVTTARAATIYVNDNWGATPTRSHSTVPYEDAVEDRIWYNPQVNQYFADEASALAASAPEEVADGPDAVPTGLEAKEYFPLAVSYDNLNPGDPINNFDDPATEATESLTLTYGTDAFGSVGAAIYAIGTNAAAGGAAVDKIVILGGTYYEAVYYPNNVTNNATVSPYYRTTKGFATDLTNAAFFGKMQTNFSIVGDPADRPVFTRGMVFDNEYTDGLTVANLYIAGVPGTAGNGVPKANSNRMIDVIGGSITWPAPVVPTAAMRKDLTIRNMVFDGMGVRIPFSSKNPSAVAPAFNNRVGTTGGRGGVVWNGEYGTFTATDNTFKKIRSFWNFDMNGAGNENATWTDAIIRRNTLEDCWGNFGVRGEGPGNSGRQPQAGLADNAWVEYNTVRDMGEGVIEILQIPENSVTSPTLVPHIFDQYPSSGAAFKLFNIRNPYFRNNTIIRVNIMQDWFTKPQPWNIPGDANFIPMGAGVLIRDIRRSDINLQGPWSDFTYATVTGNLFEQCQQGVGVDPPGAQKFIPGGIAQGNTFIRCRSGFFFYDGLISDIAMTITGNIFAQATDDPMNVGVGAGSAEQDLIGGIVFDQNSGVTTPTVTMNLEGNYFDEGGASGPNGIQDNSGTIDDNNYTGDQPSEQLDGFPDLDTDGDSVADTVEDEIGTNKNMKDTDGDTIPDGTELRIGTDPLDPNDPDNTTDTDKDRIPDWIEALNGTDPNDADSDGDGIRDDYETLVGTDPNNPNSTPSFGDANEDGVSDNVDAVSILEAFLELDVLKTVNRDRVDINRDGVVDNVDAIILFNYQVNNIPYLPFP